MKKTSLLFIFLVLPGLMGFAPLPTRPAVSAQQTAIDSSMSAYGYTMTTEASSWVDIALEENNITADFLDPDDSVVSRDIGFNFPFHGVSYPTITVSINGILLLGDDSGDAYYLSTNVPFDEAPNNFIAPLWEDLTLGEMGSELPPETAPTYAIYYDSDLTASPKRLIVEWHVTNESAYVLNPLVFQAVLYENGDIVFNYNDLSGETSQATVGLEDARGLDGIQYRSAKSPASLDAATAVRFDYPADSPHLSGRSTSHNLGGFLNNYSLTYAVPIENTGTSASTFSLWTELAESGGDPAGWEIEIFSSDQHTPLGQSGVKFVTPSIAPGATYTAYVRVAAPSNTPIGNYQFHTLHIAPSGELGRVFEIDMRTAVPTPFAQGFVDGGTGVMLQFNRPSQVDLVKTVNYFTGSTMTLGETSRYGILYAWERQSNILPNSSHIEYVTASSMGSTVSAANTLQENSDNIKDELPKMTTNQHGRVGFVFVRGNYTDLASPVYNLMFSILDRSGQVLVAPFSLTGNNEVGTGAGGLMISGAPTLATNTANDFLLAWAQGHYVGDDQIDDLYLAWYDENGGAIQTGIQLTRSEDEIDESRVRYMEPDLAELGRDELGRDRYLLAYTRYDELNGLNIAARVIDGNGDSIVDETLLPGAIGQRPEAVVLNDNRILITWTNLETRQISYALVDYGLGLVAGPVDLPSVTGLDMDYVSASRDISGNAILTWGDRANRALYYALIDSNGAAVTPAMIFRKASNPAWPKVFISQTGESNASLVGTNIHRYYMPLSVNR